YMSVICAHYSTCYFAKLFKKSSTFCRNELIVTCTDVCPLRSGDVTTVIGGVLNVFKKFVKNTEKLCKNDVSVRFGLSTAEGGGREARSAIPCEEAVVGAETVRLE